MIATAFPYTRGLPMMHASSPASSLKSLKKSSSPKKVAHRSRSSSASSMISSCSNSGRSAPGISFPTLNHAPDAVLEANPSDTLWKVFVAFEQDCRDSSNLVSMLETIEATVVAAVEPLTLAGRCLSDCADFIENDLKTTLDLAIAGYGNSPCETSKAHMSGTTSKQFTLASNKLSSAASTYRSTQSSLKLYGGIDSARKTCYQLDTFAHVFALPTSAAIHKRGTEWSAANKWIKRILIGDGRSLDGNEMSMLRRAKAALLEWAEGLRKHASLLTRAANDTKHLLIERQSLKQYNFPPRAADPAQLAPPITISGFDGPSGIAQALAAGVNTASHSAPNVTADLATYDSARVNYLDQSAIDACFKAILQPAQDGAYTFPNRAPADSTGLTGFEGLAPPLTIHSTDVSRSPSPAPSYISGTSDVYQAPYLSSADGSSYSGSLGNALASFCSSLNSSVGTQALPESWIENLPNASRLPSVVCPSFLDLTPKVEEASSQRTVTMGSSLLFGGAQDAGFAALKPDTPRDAFYHQDDKTASGLAVSSELFFENLTV